MTHSIYDFSKLHDVLLVKNFVEYHLIFQVQQKNKNNSVVLCLMNEDKTTWNK